MYVDLSITATLFLIKWLFRRFSNPRAGRGPLAMLESTFQFVDTLEFLVTFELISDFYSQ